ncbi:hypothetical protein AB0C10_37140 [Microbispora amethystogenes]|uniref:hypothetical protein n=1 Tax=Microbispora amethystogenes TaxID=1427754 RepID=UPI003408499C
MSVHTTNGRIGALESWSRTVDRAARTEKARTKSKGSLEYWLEQVDPDGQMDADTRMKAAQNAHRAHMLRLAQASAAARRRKASGSAA